MTSQLNVCVTVRFKGFTHHTATDLKILNQEEHIVTPHQTLSLSLQQQSHRVILVRQHHNDCMTTGVIKSNQLCIQFLKCSYFPYLWRLLRCT